MTTNRKAKRIRSLLVGISVLVVLLALIAYFATISSFEKSIARSEGTLELAGLREEVVVRRDELGVPFIEAANESDLFFAAGYVQASERLWQMVSMKMAMQGRLSEIGGPLMLGTDIFMRSLGLGEFVRQQLPKIDATVREHIASFSRGVNAYIETQEHLPPEFKMAMYTPEPWDAESSGAILAMLTFQLSFNYLEELSYLILAQKVGYQKAAYLFPIYPDEPLPFDEAAKLRSVPHEKLLATLGGWHRVRQGLGRFVHAVPASNNWAVAPGRTASGKTIVANDTHIPILVPSIWMLMHLKCPTYEAAGALVPGTPFVNLGYNKEVAWGITMVMADHEDIFVEKLKEINGEPHYLYKDRWLPTEAREEKFDVRFSGTETVTIHSTRHGTILNTALERIGTQSPVPLQPPPLESDYGLALSVALTENSDTGLGFYRLGKARDVHEVREAISHIKDMHLNFTFGDRENIGWQVSGHYPIRKKGKGLLPSPGWSGEYDWQGAVAFEDFPHALNPEEGFLATANNRTIGADYPFRLSSSWENPDRVNRLRQVLQRENKATPEQMNALQNDRFSIGAAEVQKLLFDGSMAVEVQRAIGRLQSRADRKRASEALTLLSREKFDSTMHADSINAAVYGAFLHVFTRETFLDELGPENGLVWQTFTDVSAMGYSALHDHLRQRENSPFWDNVQTDYKEEKADILALALARTISFCENRMGADRKAWRWGKLHTYTWRHDLAKQVPLLFNGWNRGPYPAGGDSSTPNIAAYHWGDDFDVFLIPILRMIVDFGREEPLQMLTVPGQSGHPGSPHYDDMIPHFLEGKLHSLPFDPEKIKARYRQVLVLEPK